MRFICTIKATEWAHEDITITHKKRTIMAQRNEKYELNMKKHIMAVFVYDITQSQGTSWVVFVRFGGDLRVARAPSLFAVATCIIHYIHAKTHSHSHSRSFTFTCICGFHNCTQSGRAKWEGGAGWVLYYSILWELGPMTCWHIYGTLEEGIKILSRNARRGRGGRDQISLNIWHND